MCFNDTLANEFIAWTKRVWTKWVATAKRKFLNTILASIKSKVF